MDIENKTITRDDLAIEVQEEFGLTYGEAYKIVCYLFSKIEDHLVQNDSVYITGFGKFLKTTKQKKEYTLPSIDGELDEHVTPVFRPSRTFKTRVRTREK